MAKMRKKLGKIERKFYLTFKQQLVWMISTGFAIVAAIVWKDAIVLVMKRYIPAGTELANAV